MKAAEHRIKYACYTANLSMAVVSSLSPLLFLTFRELYHISFSMLGALVLVNFSTQLAVDLLLSFFSHKFSVSLLVKLTPLLTVAGFLLYAVFPFIFPNAVYAGLMMGTVLFSASGGFSEVLISPLIAALPSDQPEREMSKLHSVYAWGVVGVVIVSTAFLSLFGRENWQYLALLWTLLPLFSFCLFFKSALPVLKTPEKASNVVSSLKQKKLLLLILCIFLGGASECTMSQWSSGYLEQALGIPKIWGDIFGVAMFALMLGVGRTLYARFGKNIYRVLFFSAAGAAACYLIAAISSVPIIGLLSCAFTGLCTAMLWPGSLIAVSDHFPSAGVAVFALMAAGGDLGGAVGPQAVGAITDFALTNETTLYFASVFGVTAEQFAMKLGLLSACIFPIAATFLFAYLYKTKNKEYT